MLLLADVGEWVNSNILFGLVFLISGIGVVGLGWWVMRGDRLNRAALEAEPVEEAAAAEPAPAPRRTSRRRAE